MSKSKGNAIVPSEILEKGAQRVVVDPPKVNPNPGGQSKNPRFRNAGIR